MAIITYKFGEARISLDTEKTEIPQDGDRLMSFIKDAAEQLMLHNAEKLVSAWLNGSDLQENLIRSSIKHYYKTGKWPIYQCSKFIMTHDKEQHDLNFKHVTDNWTKDLTNTK